MKNLNVRWLGLLLLSFCLRSFAQSPPPTPNQQFPFPTNFVTALGNAALEYSNVISTPVTDFDSLLILDRTNLATAFLNYAITDSVPVTVRNLNYSQATAVTYYCPNWASVSAGGSGPGAPAILIAGGDWGAGNANGLLEILIDSPGSNLVFRGIKAGATNVFDSVPISWRSNVFHQVALEWTSGSDDTIYIDGATTASSNGPTYVPARATWTNGFWLGSDNTGHSQMRGAMYLPTTWSSELGGFETNWWKYDSNLLATWQSGLGGGGFFGSFMSPASGVLTPNGTGTNCVVGGGVMFRDMTAFPDTNGDGGTTFSFSVTGGGPDTNYDVLATSALWTNNMTNSTWVWLGQATNTGRYAATNQPSNQRFYVLGGTPANDGSGLTAAFENLISHGATNDSYGTPFYWYLSQGLNPVSSGIATQDADGDGLGNYQEYLYGTKPLVSEGFSVWVSSPNGITGIP